MAILGNIMGTEESGLDKNFGRSLFMQLYISEFYAATIFNLPPMLRWEFQDRIVIEYVPLHKDDLVHGNK